MPEQTSTAGITNDVGERAVDAAMAVFDSTLKLVAPHRWLVGEALDAASAVYAEAEAAEVDRMLAETGIVAMEVVDGGVRLRLKHAHDIAVGMVSAFDALIHTRGAENYVEWESTVTDPAWEEARDAGVPADQRPPHRQYTFMVVKPGGKTPHQLRLAAEQERDALAARLHAAHDALTRIGDGDDDSFTTLESTVEYVVRSYRAIATAESQAADEVARLRAELNTVADLAYRANPGDAGAAADALQAIQVRARSAANGGRG